MSPNWEKYRENYFSELGEVMGELLNIDICNATPDSSLMTSAMLHLTPH